MRHGIDRPQLTQAAARLAFSLFIVLLDEFITRSYNTCACAPLFIVLWFILNLCRLLSSDVFNGV